MANLSIQIIMSASFHKTPLVMWLEEGRVHQITTDKRRQGYPQGGGESNCKPTANQWSDHQARMKMNWGLSIKVCVFQDRKRVGVVVMVVGWMSALLEIMPFLLQLHALQFFLFPFFTHNLTAFITFRLLLPGNFRYWVLLLLTVNCLAGLFYDCRF